MGHLQSNPAHLDRQAAIWVSSKVQFLRDTVLIERRKGRKGRGGYGGRGERTKEFVRERHLRRRNVALGTQKVPPTLVYSRISVAGEHIYAMHLGVNERVNYLRCLLVTGVIYVVLLSFVVLSGSLYTTSKGWVSSRLCIAGTAIWGSRNGRAAASWEL